jgi:hypothetical protein
VVNYLTSASDVVSGPAATTSVPASGSTFGLGTTTVNVSATDAGGNVGTGSFTVTVVDTTVPVITLTGPDPLFFLVGETYADPGASAADLVDGNLTASIVPGGQTVDTNVPGTYTRTYTVTDASGNSALKQRSVIVVPLIPPALVVECLRNGTDDTQISFETMLGLDYEIHTSTDLITWNVLDTLSGDGLPVQIIHTGGGVGPRRFYKAVVRKTVAP